MHAELPALVIALIVFQVGDAAACLGPLPFIERSLDRVGCPPPVRRVLPFVKLDSAIGLTIGLFVPIVGVVTVVALVAYFVVAIAFHVRSGDTAVNTVPAIAMLVVVAVVGGLCFVPAV
jgi:hypothetical protein